MQGALLALVIALSALVSADFIASNTTVCMGAFPLDSCYRGVVVFSGVKNTTDYTCSKLMAAEDESYITNGTMSYYGGPEVWSDDVCGHGKLHFVKDHANYTNYIALDGNGNQVADCRNDTSLFKHCSQWVGAFFFQGMYRCTSNITCE